MEGRRAYWPLAPGALRRWAFCDVDQPDMQVQQELGRRRDWRVKWAETAIVETHDSPHSTVELWELRYKRWGDPLVHVLYLVDATIWLRLSGTIAVAFFLVTSWGDRGSAKRHADLLRTRLPEVAVRL